MRLTLGTPWTVAHQAPLWSVLPFPSPGDLPDPGIVPGSPALAGESFTIWATWEAHKRKVGRWNWWRTEMNQKPTCTLLLEDKWGLAFVNTDEQKNRGSPRLPFLVNEKWVTETHKAKIQKGNISRVFSNTTVQKHQVFDAQPSSQSNSHIHTWPLEKP